MPSRMPIIPTSADNRILLRALHNEMQEKDFIKVSNIKQSENKFPEEKATKEANLKSIKPTLQKDDMPYQVINRASVNHNVQADSSSTASSTSQSERSDSSSSSVECRRQRFEDTHNDEDRHHREGWKHVPAEKEKIELSEKDKQQIREGYQRFVLNGERPPTALSFELQLRGVGSSHASDEIIFPLEGAAAGEVDDIAIKDVMKIEKVTKKKTKQEKQAIAEAKLSVTEAKQNEFEARLRARQARIDERHAKLCYRRAIIKRAEDRLQNLESRLDDEEECHRDRERRVKNRERRVRQEEAGIQIKEESLRRREAIVTASLNDIDKRRKLVAEKESMFETMEDILSIKESQLKQKEEKKNKTSSLTPFMRLLKKPAYKSGNSNYGVNATYKDQVKSHETIAPNTDNSSSSSVTPVPIPRKVVKNNFENKPSKDKSDNNESTFIVDSTKTPKVNDGKNSQADSKSVVPTMGLWL